VNPPISVAVPAVREALKEIKSVARTDPAVAAEGAVRFLERVSPALEHVDSSSGAMGTAVYQAVSVLAEIIGDAPLETSQRARLLDRSWEALQDDRMGYLDASKISGDAVVDLLKLRRFGRTALSTSSGVIWSAGRAGTFAGRWRA
jgi:hypothetical protein